MNKQLEHITLKNFVNIKKDYYEEIIKPHFKEVTETISPITKFYQIANKNICINFYNKIFADNLSYAISHNEVEGLKSIDLTINIWDSFFIGIPLISPWSNEKYTFEKETNLKNNHSYDSFLGAYIAGEQTISIYDKTNKTAYFWSHDASLAPDWVTGAPVRTILHWFLAESNTHLLHGAVIGSDHKSVLLTAKGGSGKSTTALSCLLSGMNYLSDDYVAIELSDKVTAHSLYNSAKLVPSHLKTFPQLENKVWNKDNLDKEKAVIFLSECFPNQIVRKSKLKAIMIPVIKDIKETRIIPASKMQALLAIMPTTLFQLPLTEVNKMEALKEIISRTPCYFLELSPDIAKIPDVIKEFLND